MKKLWIKQVASELSSPCHWTPTSTHLSTQSTNLIFYHVEIRSNIFRSTVTNTANWGTKSTASWWSRRPATSRSRVSPAKGKKPIFCTKARCLIRVFRAWRLLSIVAAYFACSDTLLPYLMEHLSSAANDRRRICHGTAAVCVTNLRKTQRCGGRKNVPSVEEVTAVSAGKHQSCFIFKVLN